MPKHTEYIHVIPEDNMYNKDTIHTPSSISSPTSNAIHLPLSNFILRPPQNPPTLKISRSVSSSPPLSNFSATHLKISPLTLHLHNPKSRFRKHQFPMKTQRFHKRGCGRGGRAGGGGGDLGIVVRERERFVGGAGGGEVDCFDGYGG